MKTIIILAFLQNLWVKDPRYTYDFFKKYPNSRNNIIKSLLFMGCLTGRRIKKAFGWELADRIIYDECTKEIANNPKTICNPDLEHIKETLNKFKPDRVITFGAIAYKAVSKVFPKDKIFKSPHPAARQKNTMDKLKSIAKELT